MRSCFFILCITLISTGCDTNTKTNFNSITDEGIKNNTVITKQSNKKTCRSKLERLYSSYDLELDLKTIKMLCNY